MNLEQLSCNPPFSLLPKAGVQEHCPSAAERLPVITRCGINLYFPSRHCPDYLALVCAEMAQRSTGSTSPGNVTRLWLRGYPLRQLTPEDLTALVFRIGHRFNLHPNRSCERGIHLGAEHCSRENLALLKGLGFEVIRVTLNATLAGSGSGIDPFQRAIATIREFAGIRLQATVHYDPDTSDHSLRKVLTTLVTTCTEDIELQARLSLIHHSQRLAQCQRLFFLAEAALAEAGYRLFGDHCFKIPGHPHQLLQDNQRLAYGPWGFYNIEVDQWLGVGLGADGLLDGYFYRNTHSLSDYRARLGACKPTAISWSTTPISQQPLYELIQQLFCYHRIANPTLLSFATREKLMKKSWLLAHNHQLRLTPEGIHNLQHLIREIIQQTTDDQT